MSTTEPTSPHPGSAGESNAVTGGILSLSLALTALMGGGTFATALQFWAFRITSPGPESGAGWFARSAGSLPTILLGIMAIGVGAVAVRSPHTLASATGKAGVAMGILAVFGGIVLALSFQSGPFM